MTILAIVAMLLVGGKCDVPSLAATNDVTIDHFRQLVSESESQIRCLDVEYIAEHVSGHRANDAVSVRVGVCGEKRSRMMWHLAEGSLEKDKEASFAVYDGKNWDLLTPYSRRLETSQKFARPPFTDKIRANAFLELLGWWPLDDCSSPPESDGFMLFVREALKNDKSRVTNRFMVIDNCECIVVECPGKDRRLLRLYLDLNKGIIRRKEAVWADKVLIAADLTNFQEVATGVQLPFRVRRTIKGDKSDVVTNFTVSHYVVNLCDELKFDLPRLPGTLVLNRDTSSVMQIPGGFELLDRMVQLIPAKRVSAYDRIVIIASTVVAIFDVCLLAFVLLGRKLCMSQKNACDPEHLR